MLRDLCSPGRPGAAALAVLAILQAGCTGLFFYPESGHRLTPARVQLQYRNVTFAAADGTRLHGWLLPAQTDEARGTVLHLHGNAQNISTHFLAVHWLPGHGWNVLTFDYRGYGRSEGEPEADGIMTDARAAYRYLLDVEGVPAQRLVVYGQSLGGSVAIAALPDADPPPAGLVVESAFTGFREIAREKLGSFWLTWPFQYPLSWTVTSDHSAVEAIAEWSPVPVLIMHSRSDRVVPVRHGRRLYDAAAEPKQLWIVDEAGHAAILAEPHRRRRLLEWLDARLPQDPAE